MKPPSQSRYSANSGCRTILRFIYKIDFRNLKKTGYLIDLSEKYCATADENDFMIFANG